MNDLDTQLLRRALRAPQEPGYPSVGYPEPADPGDRAEHGDAEAEAAAGRRRPATPAEPPAPGDDRGGVEVRLGLRLRLRGRAQSAPERV